MWIIWRTNHESKEQSIQIISISFFCFPFFSPFAALNVSGFVDGSCFVFDHCARVCVCVDGVFVFCPVFSIDCFLDLNISHLFCYACRLNTDRSMRRCIDRPYSLFRVECSRCSSANTLSSINLRFAVVPVFWHRDTPPRNRSLNRSMLQIQILKRLALESCN